MMNPRMIDANYLIAEFTDRARKARQWKEGAILNGNEEAAIRADAVLAFLVEVKAAIDDAPTVNDKAYAIGYAAGSREGYKKGYEAGLTEPKPIGGDVLQQAWERGYKYGLLEEERPTGEWIMNKTSPRGRNYTCTHCKKISRNKSEYCPNCGARMEAEEC